MTAFAASLFALGAMMSVWVMGTSWKRYGRDALAVRGKLAACPETFMLRWKLIERVQVPALAALRPDRQTHAARLLEQRPGLEWPGMGPRTLERAA